MNKHRYRSSKEVLEAIETLSLADRARLGKASWYWALPKKMDPKELLNEAFVSALDPDGKKWRYDVTFPRFMNLAMRSIASEEKRRAEKTPQPSSLAGKNGDSLDVADPNTLTAEPEELLSRLDEYDAMHAAAMEAVQNDEQAELVLLGMMEGLAGKELIEFAEINKKTLATKQKYIRRHIEAAFPNGWTI